MSDRPSTALRAGSVLILAGATASGKTELAIALAREFDAEIVGADSRQIYRGMPIGTAAPATAQLAQAPHHLVGFLDPMERYSAARFTHDAIDAIEGIHRRGRRAIVAGGTGFYIRALTGGFDLAPQYDETLRMRLAREALLHESEFLYEWLRLRNPQRAAAIGARDTYRILRALEVALGDEPPAPRYDAPRTLADARLTPTIVYLDLPWNVIDARIARRAEAMLSGGLLDEAERIGASAIAANAVGYPQALAYLRGWSTQAELRMLLERATRRFARRQRAWFRSDPATLWCAPESVATLVREKLGWSAKRV